MNGITLSGCRSGLLHGGLGRRLVKQRHYRTRQLCRRFSVPDAFKDSDAAHLSKRPVLRRGRYV
jgi:hypothetical protein